MPLRLGRLGFQDLGFYNFRIFVDFVLLHQQSSGRKSFFLQHFLPQTVVLGQMSSKEFTIPKFELTFRTLRMFGFGVTVPHMHRKLILPRETESTLRAIKRLYGVQLFVFVEGIESGEGIITEPTGERLLVPVLPLGVLHLFRFVREGFAAQRTFERFR